MLLVAATHNVLPFRVALLQRPRWVRLVSTTTRHVAGAAEAAKQKTTQDDPEELDKFLKMVDSGRLGFDPWGQPLPLFDALGGGVKKDLHVPTPLSALPKGTSIRDRWRFWRAGLDNSVSNFITMYRIARHRSFPWNPKARALSPQIFRTSSTRPGTYLAPLRDIALDSYKQINTAIASNDASTLHALTDGAFRKRALARLKSLHTAPAKKPSHHPPRTRPKPAWRLHTLASPVTCVSIRGQQVHFGRAEPAFGTRWAVQACMRLDTWQSLSIPPSHAPGPAASEPEPKRVLEYLVFEKRMWYDEPWIVRDQLWEGLP